MVCVEVYNTYSYILFLACENKQTNKQVSTIMFEDGVIYVVGVDNFVGKLIKVWVKMGVIELV